MINIILIRFDYVLVDSWFTCLELIKFIVVYSTNVILSIW